MKRPHRHRVPWAAYLWPGLAHLWIKGSVAGLVLAIGFTFLANVLLLSVVVWPEWLTPRLQLSCGATVVVLWLAALIETRGELRRLALEKESKELNDADPDDPQPVAPAVDRKPDAQLCLAQRQYLAADWVAAERTLRGLLRNDSDDVEANLLLVGVYRRMGRTADALRRLRRLHTRDAAARWEFEIQREVNLLNRSAGPLQTEETPRQAA